MARDHVFELVKLTMEALKGHMRKANCQIDPKVLDSLCETCIEFTAFTEKQKQVIQNVASSTPEPARQDLEVRRAMSGCFIIALLDQLCASIPYFLGCSRSRKWIRAQGPGRPQKHGFA